MWRTWTSLLRTSWEMSQVRPPLFCGCVLCGQLVGACCVDSLWVRAVLTALGCSPSEQQALTAEVCLLAAQTGACVTGEWLTSLPSATAQEVHLL